MSKSHLFGSAFLFVSALLGVGCNGNVGQDSLSGSALTSAIQGQDHVSQPPAVIPPNTPTEPAPPTQVPPAGGPAIGPTCETSDTNHMCLALKYVVYENSQGTSVVAATQVATNIEDMNQVWSQCNIGFEAEEFLSVNPTDYGLTFNTANNSELNIIRGAFVNDKTLLMVTTGSWNRNGSLGSTGANAWANMPGNSIMGVVLESPVGDYPNILAHELGHYLNLDHYSDTSDLMNPIIYSTSTKLTTSQCNMARSAVNAYWTKMLR